MAQDVLDSASFQAGEGGLPRSPSNLPTRLRFVLRGAGQPRTGLAGCDTESVFDNCGCNRRGAEQPGTARKRIRFGAAAGDCSWGTRGTVSLELFAQDDATTTALYQAARQHLPISMMFQLGQTAGQLVGIFLKSVMPGSARIRRFGQTAEVEISRDQGARHAQTTKSRLLSRDGGMT